MDNFHTWTKQLLRPDLLKGWTDLDFEQMTLTIKVKVFDFGQLVIVLLCMYGFDGIRWQNNNWDQTGILNNLEYDIDL
jgi:hypothetical protein